MSTSESPVTADLQAELKRIEQNLGTLTRVMTTRFPVAQTPKEVIWTLNKAKLYRYIPVVPPEQRHPVPLLLIFALINRPYILDLRPGNSFIEYMLQQGYDVYLLDWGAPGPDDQHLKLDDYALTYLPRAIRKMKAVSGASAFSLLGWCIGAIITSIYGALRPDEGLRNLLLLTAPLDFSNKEVGGFMGMADERFLDVDRLIAAFGNMPGELIDYAAKALRPTESYIGIYLRLWENLQDARVVESWHAMNTWVNDVIPLAGAAYRQLIVDLYRENKLIKGELKIRGESVDLGRIRANLLNVIAESDHIAPPCQSESVMALVDSEDKHLLKVAGGHINIMAGSRAVKHTWPQIDAWLAARSD